MRKVEKPNITEDMFALLEKYVETKVEPYLQSLLDQLSKRLSVNVYFYQRVYSDEWFIS